MTTRVAKLSLQITSNRLPTAGSAARLWLLPRPSLQIVSRKHTCELCRRSFTTATWLEAGHNKWSKVKHIKKATDKVKTQHRTSAAKVISLYTRLYGPDVKFNSKLASAIEAAKKGWL